MCRWGHLPWNAPKDSMESTLLPMAERLRHRRHEDAGCIFSSHRAMMLCRCQGASQVCSSPRRRPILLRPTQLHSSGMAPITPGSGHLFPHALSGTFEKKKKKSKTYILAEKRRLCFVPESFYYKTCSRNQPLFQQNAVPPYSSQGTPVRLQGLCCLCGHAVCMFSWELTSRSGRSLGSSACIWLSSPSRSGLSLGSSSGSATYSRAAFSVAPRE